MLVLMRGWSGSGKSRIVQDFIKAVQDCAKDYSGSLVFSTDDFWLVDGKYVFDSARLAEAHDWTINRVRSLLKESGELFRGDDRHLFIDNTNIKLIYMQPYIDLAKEYDVPACQYVPVEVMDAVYDWRKVDAVGMQRLALLTVYSHWKRSNHSVPFHTVVRWLEEFEIVNKLPYFV